MSFTVASGAVGTQFVQHEKERGKLAVKKKKSRGKKGEESSSGFVRAKANLLFWPFMLQAYIDTVYK